MFNFDAAASFFFVSEETIHFSLASNSRFSYVGWGNLDLGPKPVRRGQIRENAFFDKMKSH